MNTKDNLFDRLVHELKAMAPGIHLIDQASQLAAYECDGLSAYRQVPNLVVLPKDIREVQSVMAVCNRLEVPIVGRGGGTSLSGGALPHEDGIVLSLAKMNRILEIDEVNRTARVQPGVRNLAISQAVADLGLYYAPDPSSQIACTIGGNVAENAGGVHCLKYGLTVHNIISVRVATIEGDLIDIGSDALETPGLNLLSLILTRQNSVVS